MNVQILLDRLEKVKRTGHGKWQACCPAHADSDPSMVITEVDDRLLVHCFAGCGAAAIMEAVDLSLKDLFGDNPIRHHMYGGTPEYRKNEIKTQKQRERDELLLKLCAKSRKAGKRLPESDLKAEREAFLRLRT